MSERIPIGDALPGAKIHALPEDGQLSQALVFVKTVDQDGDTAWSMRTTEALNLNEVLGVLLVYTDILRRDLAEEWDF